MIFNIRSMCDFLFCMFAFYFAYSVFLYLLRIVSPFVYSCLFPICVQNDRPLRPSGNTIAVNR